MLSGSFEIDQPRLRTTNGSIGPILHCYAVNQQPMKHPVPVIERRAFKTGDFTESVVDRLGGQGRIQPHKRFAQSSCKQNLSIILTLGKQLIRRDLRAVFDRVAKALQPRERSVFDCGFGEARHIAHRDCLVAGYVSDNINHAVKPLIATNP